MKYEDLSFVELERLLQEEHDILEGHKAKIAEIAHWRFVKAQELELSRKLGSLGDSEMEILRKLLSQTTTPTPIESAEDIQL